MRPSLVAVLAMSLVGLSGAAWSDGMPAKKHHAVKAKKVVKTHHRHGPDCPPGHDDSWAIAERLNHEEWLRHRQADLGHRRPVDDISRYDHGGRDYAWDQGGHDRWEKRVERWDDGRGRGYVEGARDGEAYGWAWRDRDHGYDGRMRRHMEKRVYESRRGDWSRDWPNRPDWVDEGGGYTEERYEGHGGWAYGDGRGWERHERWEAPRHHREVVRKHYRADRGADRYGYEDRGYAGGYGSGYAEAERYGYAGGYGYAETDYAYGRGYRFYYDADYAGRDAYGYLTWPGKTPG